MPKARMTQPVAMKTRRYVYGVEPVNGNDAWSLFKACAEGNEDKVVDLLAEDPKLVNAQFWYQFPLHMAVRGGHEKVVKRLLRSGADPGQSRFTYNSWDKLLADARLRGYSSIVLLLERTLKRKYGYSRDFTAVKEAIVSRSSRRVGTVLRRTPELALASDALGNNPIHWCVLSRQLQLIDRFHELGTRIDAHRADGQTPLQLAVDQTYDYWYRGVRGRNHPSIRNAWVIAGYLLSCGAKYTLPVACAFGDREYIERILKRNPGAATRLDSSRVSPLSYAAREGYTHIVRLLLDHGADPNVPEDLAPRGRALFESCGGNHYDVAELLLQHGADPNAGVDSCGCCLTIVEHHHQESCKPLQRLLRKHGAHNPPYVMSSKQLRQALRKGEKVIHDEEFFGNVLDKNSLDLLKLYAKKVPSMQKMIHGQPTAFCPRSPELVRWLLKHGLDPNRPDWVGRTLLHVAAERGDRRVAQVLLKAGANINAKDVDFKGTPLAAAIRHQPRGNDATKYEKCRQRMVKFLLKRGANTELPDDEPWATPMAWALRGDRQEIVEILEKHSDPS